jgi:hypothetical protein
MICVTPYVGEARSVTSRTGFMHTALLKSGIGIVMQPCERWRWRGVRHMAFHIRHKATCRLPRFPLDMRCHERTISAPQMLAPATTTPGCTTLPAPDDSMIIPRPEGACGAFSWQSKGPKRLGVCESIARTAWQGGTVWQSICFK